MRGSKVIIFLIEANKSSRSDKNYIRALMNSLYSKEFQIKFIYMNGKTNYKKDRTTKEIKNYKSIFKPDNFEIYVVYIYDTDDHNRDRDCIRINNDIKTYCDSKKYFYIWFHTTIEEVLLGEFITRSKVQESKKYLENVARGKTKIDVRNLKNLEYHTKSGSNFCLIIEEIKKS